MTSKKVVYRVEDGMAREDILCTTYQMRNFYRQMGDGFFSTLDVMNYIQHHQVVKWCKPGNRVLDVCCGRGLLLPMLRYQRKDIGAYVGVDIKQENAIYRAKRVTDGKAIDGDYYPFPVSFVQANAAEMADHLDGRFQMIVYTSSIEHMHKEMGQASLHQCREVAADDAVMILTCPNTPEKQDGYDTQYRAHVYEWKRSELLQGLADAGWKVITEYGLLHSKKALEQELDAVGMGSMFRRVAKFVPGEWLIPVFSPMFPRSAKEIGFICRRM